MLSLVKLGVFLILRVDAIHDLLCKVIHAHVIRPTPVRLRFAIIDGFGPGVGDLLTEVWLICNAELWHHLLDRCTELLWVERNPSHVVHLSLEFASICLKELNGTLDAVVDVYHWKVGLRPQPALILAFLKSCEEDLCRVIGCAVEIVLLTADHTWVTNRAEVDAELVCIVGSNHFIEDFADAINGLRLEYGVNWGHNLGEVIAAEHSDCRGNHDPAFAISCNVQSIDASIYVYLSCAVWEPLAEGRQNRSQVHYVIDFVLLDDLIVSLKVANI